MASNSHDAAHDAIIGGLIRQGLGGTAEAAGSCPDPGVLAAYYERSLNATERVHFETHLSKCARCREQVAAMVRADEQPATPTRRLWFWDWRLIGVAGAAMLVMTIWGVRRATFAPVARTTSDQPLVAMSRPVEPPQMHSAAPEQKPKTPESHSPSAKSLIVPKSLDRAVANVEREPETKTRQNTNEKQKPLSEVDTPAKNARSFQMMNQATTPGAADQANSDAILKKQSENEMAAAAPAPSAPPSPMSTRATPSGSAASVASPNEGLRIQQQKANAPLAGAEIGGFIAQGSDQRSGSTIIQTPDSKILWRIVSERFVERTEDGGATWRGQAPAPAPAADAQLTAGSAPSSKVCWLVGRSGAILVTKDAIHWKTIPPPIPADFVAIVATSDSAAIVTAADGQKFTTGNQGKKWVPAK